MPVCNERKTLREILDRVLRVPIDKEVIIIDDGSTDGTTELLQTVAECSIKVVFHCRTLGKGASIRTGLEYARGNFIIVQDGDLEYDPMDYLDLLSAMDKEVGAVYGVRNFKRGKNVSSTTFWLGGLFLSRLANLLYGLQITDEATGYKLFRADILKSLQLECVGFEFCPEVTAKLAKKGLKIKETPINYYPRQVTDGKKIRWTDGLVAVWTLIKYRFTD
jgi:glycosyltransferase involved in cell wall biosynthesis